MKLSIHVLCWFQKIIARAQYTRHVGKEEHLYSFKHPNHWPISSILPLMYNVQLLGIMHYKLCLLDSWADGVAWLSSLSRTGSIYCSRRHEIYETINLKSQLVFPAAVPRLHQTQILLLCNSTDSPLDYVYTQQWQTHDFIVAMPTYKIQDKL